MIGDADTKNALRDERDELAAPTPEVQVIGDGNGSAEASGVSAQAKGTKRGKKKG